MRDKLLKTLREMSGLYRVLFAATHWKPRDISCLLAMQRVSDELEILLLAESSISGSSKFISYETRERLTTIIGYAEMLLDENPPVRSRHALRELRNCCTRLMACIMLIASNDDLNKPAAV